MGSSNIFFVILFLNQNNVCVCVSQNNVTHLNLHLIDQRKHEKESDINKLNAFKKNNAQSKKQMVNKSQIKIKSKASNYISLGCNEMLKKKEREMR